MSFTMSSRRSGAGSSVAAILNPPPAKYTRNHMGDNARRIRQMEAENLERKAKAEAEMSATPVSPASMRYAHVESRLAQIGLGHRVSPQKPSTANRSRVSSASDSLSRGYSARRGSGSPLDDSENLPIKSTKAFAAQRTRPVVPRQNSAPLRELKPETRRVADSRAKAGVDSARTINSSRSALVSAPVAPTMVVYRAEETANDTMIHRTPEKKPSHRGLLSKHDAEVSALSDLLDGCKLPSAPSHTSHTSSTSNSTYASSSPSSSHSSATACKLMSSPSGGGGGPRAARPAAATLPERTLKTGAVPQYLLERKEVWAAESEARKKREAEAAICPPGYRLMPEEERLETLALVEESLKETKHALDTMPLRITTPSAIKRKGDLELRLKKLEDAYTVFNRAKVLVKIEEED